MTSRILPMIAAGAIAAVIPVAQASSIEVLHWWTSGGESKAVKLLAEEVTAKGDKWLDTAIAGGPGQGMQITMSRMAAGDPPGAVQMPLGMRVKDVAAEKLLGDISDVSSKGKWADVLPPAVLRSVTFSGKVVAIPVTMHGVNWTWYSRKVLESAKVAPPKNWDEMMLAAEKIKAAGFIPFAVSSQSWQVAWLYGNILAGVGGRSAYEQLAAGDTKVFFTPAGQKSFDILAQIRKYADDGQNNRGWNANANLLMADKAAFQFMGDWAKAEFQAAGKAASSKGPIGCMLTPGTSDFYIMMGDVFALPAAVKPEVVAAQKRMAEIVMDRDMQIKFAKAKGSLPFRTDVKTDGFDECAQIAMKVFAKPNGATPSTSMTLRGESSGAYADALAKFWAQPTTAKQGAESVAAAMRRAQ